MIPVDQRSGSPARAPLVANGVASVGRLPVLRGIFEDTATRFARATLEPTGADAEFLAKDILAIRIGDTKDIGESYAVATFYLAPELRSKVVVGISLDLALMLIDLLFGANASFPFHRRDRALTKVESRAAEFATNALIESFQAALSKIVAVSFKPEVAEPELDWLSLAGKGSAVVVCKFHLQTAGRQGEALIAVPRIALDPFNEALSRTPNANGNVEDEAWARKLRGQVVKASVKVSAVMEKRGLTLGDVARFQVGQVIGLPLSPSSLIPLKNGQRPLFNCELGQKDGFYTVRIEEKIDAEQEFIKGIMGGRA
jgi:flagellar motor switch protein FliM